MARARCRSLDDSRLVTRDPRLEVVIERAGRHLRTCAPPPRLVLGLRLANRAPSIDPSLEGKDRGSSSLALINAGYWEGALELLSHQRSMKTKHNSPLNFENGAAGVSWQDFRRSAPRRAESTRRPLA